VNLTKARLLITKVSIAASAHEACGHTAIRRG
jgi:hypothetical protein